MAREPAKQVAVNCQLKGKSGAHCAAGMRVRAKGALSIHRTRDIRRILALLMAMRRRSGDALCLRGRRVPVVRLNTKLTLAENKPVKPTPE
jgi:hypothetical protein